MNSVAFQEPFLFSSFFIFLCKTIKLATHMKNSKTRTKRDREMYFVISSVSTSSTKAYRECASFRYNQSAGEDERRGWRRGGCSMPNRPVCPGLLYPWTIFTSVKMPVSRPWRMIRSEHAHSYSSVFSHSPVKKKKKSFGRVSFSSYAATGVVSRSLIHRDICAIRKVVINARSNYFSVIKIIGLLKGLSYCDLC